MTAQASLLLPPASDQWHPGFPSGAAGDPGWPCLPRALAILTFWPPFSLPSPRQNLQDNPASCQFVPLLLICRLWGHMCQGWEKLQAEAKKQAPF